MSFLDNILNEVSKKRVKNAFPTTQTDYKIAFIGEAPGADEDSCGIPFSGASGRLLTALLAKVGIVRSACFIGNICQIRPPNNDLSLFEWEGEEIQSGVEQLRQDLYAFQPNIVVLLGNTPLRVFGGAKYSITDFRGTLFKSSEPPLAGYKCIGSYHPAAVLRQHDWMPILVFDLKRALDEGQSKDLILPHRDIRIASSVYEIVTECSNLLTRGREAYQSRSPLPTFSTDLEGYTTGITCISLATNPFDSFVIPLSSGTGNIWSLEDEIEIWKALSPLMTSQYVKKKLQNALYDVFVLAHHKVHVVNVAEDTMLKHWELYSELPKSLEFQTSIYTKEPFYKSDRKADNLETRLRYNGKDSAVTDEIDLALEGFLRPKPTGYSHYRFNMEVLPVLQYMQLRGIKYDDQKRKNRIEELQGKSSVLQSEIDSLVPIYYGPWTKHKVPRKGQEMNINVDSSKQMATYLYKDRGFQPVLNHKTNKVTTNEEALLTIGKRTNDPIVSKMLTLRNLLTRTSNIKWKVGTDLRMRCGYNLVGTDTGRITCYTSSDGTGGNAQTVTEDDRDLYIADDGYVMFQCDLSGADGWTVASHCARLGDRTMLDDLIFGVKIAKVIALMFLKGPEITRLSREEIKELCKEISKEDPIYFGSKCCQHGTNYGMGKVLLSKTIFNKSIGKVVIEASTAERLQKYYLIRYPGIQMWHRWVANELKTKGGLTSASGHYRRFFGRPNDYDTLKAALSNEPQENTTYATNPATSRLWYDTTNRRQDGSLVIEPLHTVHDALVGQFPFSTLDSSVEKIRDYFNNPLTIAGQNLVIPFEGRYGKSWGELTEAF